MAHVHARQLEAIVRISESLAKMRLEKFATESHVEEALRLFRVSTLQAAMNDNTSGVEGVGESYGADEILDIERQIKRRLPIGAKTSERTILDNLTQKVCRTKWTM